MRIYTHPDCARHEMPGHPEQPARLRAVMDRISASGIGQQTTQILAEEISIDQISLVHPAEYTRHVMGSEPAAGLAKMDPDTFMSPGSLRASRLAAGACIQATADILDGATNRAFCAVRPPGHHAEVAAAMGFCLFNNVALAAELALSHPTIERVAIVDFDVHHCNGTVDIFKDRPEVLVCSSFQDDYYPFRYLDFTNEHIINTPLAAGTGSDEFRGTIERSWFDRINTHRPDFLLISAGFDAHHADPLAGLNLVESDYSWITRVLTDLADDHCNGRLISTLEGGYNLTALADSVEAHLKVLVN